MKKLISTLLAVIIVFMSFASTIVASADTYYYEDEKTNTIYWNEIYKNGEYEYLQVGANAVAITNYRGKEKNLKIPSKINGMKVVEIADNAFCANDYLESVVVPSSVVSIGQDAFSQSRNLKSVTLGTKIRHIGITAFYETALYESKMKSKNIVYIGQYLISCNTRKYKSSKLKIKDGTIGIADGAISTSSYGVKGKVTNVVMPDSVKFIGACALNSPNISKVTVSKNLERVGEDAFKGTEGTKFYSKNVKTYKGAKYIGNYLVKGVRTAKTVTVKNKTKVIADNAFSYGSYSKLQKVTFPDSLKSIGEYAFSNCPSLTGVKIPKNVKYIGENAFNNKKISSYKVSKDNKYFTASSGVLFNKDKTALISYPAKSDRTSYSVPKTVKYIDVNAFCNAKNLEKVKLNDGLTFIASCAFLNCKKIKSVTIPDSVRRICFMAFGAYTTSDEDGYYYMSVKGFKIYGSKSGAAAQYCTIYSDEDPYRPPVFIAT